jgi:hypothetical protein
MPHSPRAFPLNPFAANSLACPRPHPDATHANPLSSAPPSKATNQRVSLAQPHMIRGARPHATPSHTDQLRSYRIAFHIAKPRPCVLLCRRARGKTALSDAPSPAFAEVNHSGNTYPLQKSGSLTRTGILACLSFFLIQIDVPSNTARLNIFPEGDT